MVTHSIKLQPFTVPNFVREEPAPAPRQEGFKEARAIPLYELSHETLDKLCDQFRTEVFARANNGKA